MTTHRVALETDQLERLIELVLDHRDAVDSGDVSGYGQSKTDELVDLDTLATVLKESR